MSDPYNGNINQRARIALWTNGTHADPTVRQRMSMMTGGSYIPEPTAKAQKGAGFEALIAILGFTCYAVIFPISGLACLASAWFVFNGFDLIQAHTSADTKIIVVITQWLATLVAAWVGLYYGMDIERFLARYRLYFWTRILWRALLVATLAGATTYIALYMFDITISWSGLPHAISRSIVASSESIKFRLITAIFYLVPFFTAAFYLRLCEKPSRSI